MLGVDLSRVGIGFGFLGSGRVGSGSGPKLISSNFVRNFIKFNDLILFFETLYLH